MEVKSWKRKIKQLTDRRTLSTSQLMSITGFESVNELSSSLVSTQPSKSLDEKTCLAFDITPPIQMTRDVGMSVSERTTKVLLHLKIAVSSKPHSGTIALRDVSGECGSCWNIESWRANVKGSKFVLVQTWDGGSELQAYCSSVSGLRFAIKLVTEHRMSLSTNNFERQHLRTFDDWSCASAIVLKCILDKSLEATGDYASWYRELFREDRQFFQGSPKNAFNINAPLMIDVNTCIYIEEKAISFAYDNEKAVRLSCLCRTGLNGSQEPLLLINFNAKRSKEPAVGIVNMNKNDSTSSENYGGTTSVFFLG
eukprot:TRINITY_DN70687_c0_g1_i1.p1 TRINITY_DN70687_c0_g1~~TRINITY_DN70687_c0_g1_i1.p1  ORF type:complete len:311 (-),score=23.57 TRINITY_DN70687_c0_g1_i1:648-1580(-)